MKKKSSFLLFLLVFAGLQEAATQDIQKWKLEDLKAAIQNAREPTIFNFWATFCKPCIEEIPYFQQAVKKYEKEGVRLVLVSVDLPEAYPKIKSFAAKRKYTASIFYLDETNADEFCPAVDPKWSGTIPASLFVNQKTGYRHFFEDQIKKSQLEKEIKAMITENKKPS